MKKSIFSKQFIALSCGVVVLASLVAISSALDARQQPTNSTKQTSTSKKSPTSPMISPATNNTSDADKQTAAAAANAQPITQACKLLTLHIAQQVLGANATASTPTDASSLQTASTSLGGCAYATATATASIQLVVRTPNDSLGRSENDTAFGSGKPTGVTTVKGYGQSAYWNPSNQTLNILGSNNWYIITRSTNTQADTEAVANLLKAGF